MYLEREAVHHLLFGPEEGRRFTQDSPVMPDVWLAFGNDPRAAHALLIEPARGTSPARLARRLVAALEEFAPRSRAAHAAVAFDEIFVVATLGLDELIRCVLPLTSFWQRDAGSPGPSNMSAEALRAALGARRSRTVVSEKGAALLRVAGTLLKVRASRSRRACPVEDLPRPSSYAEILARRLRGLPRADEGWESEDADEPGEDPRIWTINRNREASIAIFDSRRTVKADAATNLFALSCRGLAWAVLDTGIDAAHPAFRKRNADGELLEPDDEESAAQLSRVVASYDFTRVRDLLDMESEALPESLGERPQERAAELRRRLRRGQSVDWELVEGIVRIDHADYEGRRPGHPHGTHVAGILGGDWRRGDPDFFEDDDLVGMCPDIDLYDFRVLDGEGKGDEFSLLAALQFLRYLNARGRNPIIQGANLSLSIPHDVSNFACGRTPACQEAERLHASGVVVVAAAGNQGHIHYLTRAGERDAYRNISITDPGNAEAIITVGATHRKRPHTYGVSYFSSRGPTGDGRVKPDLVAPGEKILAPVLDGLAELRDGTSMAAPHVSGAAALIMSRHREFVGDPDRIKRVLCSSATDLGRERYFQGAGLLDVNRALQSL